MRKFLFLVLLTFSNTKVFSQEIKKPNLYILSIGINHDLKYPDNDAEDIFKYFKTQENQTFNIVTGEVLNCKENTSLGLLRDYFRNLTSITLSEHDVLLIFISSHGLQMSNGDFGILTSDYNPKVSNEINSVLSFKDDVISNIINLKCKKFLFIDACKSGQSIKISEDFGKNFENNNLLAFFSASENQSSFESDSLKHGYFTHTLLLGLSGKADIDQINFDKTIKLDELIKFTSIVVPALTIVQNGNFQNPVYLGNQHLLNLDLFKFENFEQKLKPIDRICSDEENKLRLAVLVISSDQRLNLDQSEYLKSKIIDNSKFEFVPNALLLNRNQFFSIASLQKDFSNNADYIILVKSKKLECKVSSINFQSLNHCTQDLDYLVYNLDKKIIVDERSVSGSAIDTDKNNSQKIALQKALEKIRLNIYE